MDLSDAWKGLFWRRLDHRRKGNTMSQFTSRATKPSAVDQWENEGGASPAARPGERASSSTQNLEERTRAKAYEIYQARCSAGRPGDASTDWLDAERELRTPRGSGRER